MKLNILLILAAFFILTSCDEKIDLNNAQYYDIETVVNSRNCSAKCDEMADCEGSNAKMLGTFDESSVDTKKFMFSLVDKIDEKTEMEIRLDSLIAPEVFLNIKGNDEKVIRVEGTLEGYDDGTAGSSSCDRVMRLYITDPSKVRVAQ